MEDIGRLNEAFRNFTLASKSLESSYERLQEKVQYLTGEIAQKNVQLGDALSKTEEAKDFLRGILESLHEAIIVLDPEKRVTMVNRAAEEFLGFSVEEVTGIPFDRLSFTIEKDGPETVLVIGGRRHSVIISRSDVRDIDGGVRGQVILFQDITRIRELEALQERNHRLIAMGEMAAKIVHEIRSPLCSIELYASMLARELEGTGQMELAKGISTGIRSLNNILTNMLLFARPQKPLLNEVALKKVIDESIFMLRPMMDTRELKILREGAGDLVVSGDAELLKQVFLNILINAIHASPGGHTVTVSLVPEEDFVVASIKDEGQGIEEQRLESIFDPFFSTKEKGTGLGLTIASKIMQAHGGIIRVKSRVGEGATFQLCFPCLRPAAKIDTMMKEGIFL
ncbi:MAG: ATP-binding protein [Thermodesulfovibrionales bacterium]